MSEAYPNVATDFEALLALLEDVLSFDEQWEKFAGKISNAYATNTPPNPP